MTGAQDIAIISRLLFYACLFFAFLIAIYVIMREKREEHKKL